MKIKWRIKAYDLPVADIPHTAVNNITSDHDLITICNIGGNLIYCHADAADRFRNSPSLNGYSIHVFDEKLKLLTAFS